MAIERKLLREREELKIREEQDRKKLEEKNENRRLAALNFMAEAEREKKAAAEKAKE